MIGAVNLGEVVSKLREQGVPLDEVSEALGELHLDIRPLSATQAMRIGDLPPATRAPGLSSGERPCLTLSLELVAEAYTTHAALSVSMPGQG